MRHVQLKQSRGRGRTAVQKIHTSLATKPGGCVVWVVRPKFPGFTRVRLSYRFFGGAPGETWLPMDEFKFARHTNGNASGEKNVSPAIRVIPKGRFQVIETTEVLVAALFTPPKTLPPLPSSMATSTTPRDNADPSKRVETKPKKKLVCVTCAEPVPSSVVRFCWVNKRKFEGGVYCRTRQRVFRNHHHGANFWCSQFPTEARLAGANPCL